MMASNWRAVFRSLVCIALVAVTTQARGSDDFDLAKGNVELSSAGPLAFGPPGILFVADPLDASVYAIDTKERKGDPASVTVDH